MKVCDFCKREFEYNTIESLFKRDLVICQKTVFGGYHEIHDICNDCINKLKEMKNENM